MSFMEKVGSMMMRPGEDAVPKDDAPWWMKYGSRGMGTFGGALCVIFGLLDCLSILLGNINCVIGGILQIVVGVLVMAVEAPCCCMFIDFVQTASNIVDQRPYWNRAVAYMLLPIVPIIFCFSFSSFFACALVFGTGVLYGMMALGKKGSRDDMAAMASPTVVVPGQTVPPPDSTHMEDPDVWRPTGSVDEMKAAAQGQTQSNKSNLVENAAPMGSSSAIPPV